MDYQPDPRLGFHPGYGSVPGSRLGSGSLPGSVRDVVGELDLLSSGLGGMLAADTNRDGAQAVEALVTLNVVARRVDAAQLALLDIVERSGIWRAAGALSAAAWLRLTLGLDPGVARADLKLAGALVELPALAEAYADGKVSRQHVEVIIRHGRANQTRRDALPEFEAIFTELATQQPPAVVGDVVRAWAQQIDPITINNEDTQAYERRYLHLSQLGDGWKLDGFFDQVQGSKLAAVLNAAVTRARRKANGQTRDADAATPVSALSDSAIADGALDDLLPGWLATSAARADALIDIAELAAKCGEMPESGGVRPSVSVIVPLSRLEQPCPNPSTAAANPCPSNGPASPGPAAASPGAASGFDGSAFDGSTFDGSAFDGSAFDGLAFTGGVGGVRVSNGPGEALISQQSVERITCDCEIHRIVLSPKGEPLDVGRATRTISLPMRRALVIRDGGCRVEGCDRPPPWCEGHHIITWAQGGKTELRNLVLLCSRHHHGVHQYEYTIDYAPSGKPTIRLKANKHTPVA